MSSDFCSNLSDTPREDWQAIDRDGSGRFLFYKARYHGRLHFVKTISEPYIQDLRTIESLKKEFEIGYNLDHPNIVRYHKYELTAIYEEYIDGKTLRQMLDDGDKRLKDKRFLAKICRELLDAVEYLHSKGILHLDIKPENVMITRVGDSAKIIDFGCAYSAESDTTQGFTLQYKAPEQGNGETNAYTDIYLIGRLMEELSANAGCSRHWKKFIAKATAENPASRFQSEAEAIEAIPRKHKNSRLSWGALFVSFAVFFILWLYIKNEQPKIESEPLTEETDSTETISPSSSLDSIITEVPKNIGTTKELETISEIQPTKQIDSGGAQNDTLKLREKIRAEIAAHVEKYYAQHIDHLIEGINPDTLSRKELNKLLSAIGWGRQVMYGYGNDTIGKVYPEHKEYILETVLSEVDRVQTIYVKRLGLKTQ